MKEEDIIKYYEKRILDRNVQIEELQKRTSRMSQS